MLTVFFNYIGMMSVGLVYAAQSWYADRSQRRQAMASKAARGAALVEYDVLTSTDMNEMSELHGVSSFLPFLPSSVLTMQCAVKAVCFVAVGQKRESILRTQPVCSKHTRN